MVSTVIDESTEVTALTYGTPQTSEAGSHPAINYSYDPIGRMTSLTDQDNSTTSFRYNNRDLLISKTDPLQQSTNLTYYDNGLLQTVTDRNGNITTYYYTPSGKIDHLLYSDGTGVSYVYNNLDQRTQMQDSVGVTQYSYDNAGRLISITNPYGFTISYTYDANSNIQSITYPGNLTVAYTYNQLNRLTSVTNWLGQTAAYTYDNAGKPISLVNFNGTVTNYSYDNANRLVSLTEQKSDGSMIAGYSRILDGNGNITQVTQSEPYTSVVDMSTVNYSYNSTNNRLTSDGADSFTYDNEGQLSTGYGNTYTFDNAHRLTGIGTTTTFSYDGSGNRLQAVRNGATSRYIYDAGGNLLAEADGNNNITRYYIYGAGLIAIADPSTEQVYSYHYNTAGSTIALTDQNQTIQNAYSYDPFGKITNQSEAELQPFKYIGQYGVMTEQNGFYYMRERYYDWQVGRFVSEDPLGFAGGDVNLMAYVDSVGKPLIAGTNLYQYAQNNPLRFIDPLGLWSVPSLVSNAWSGVTEGLKPG